MQLSRKVLEDSEREPLSRPPVLKDKAAPGILGRDGFQFGLPVHATLVRLASLSEGTGSIRALWLVAAGFLTEEQTRMTAPVRGHARACDESGTVCLRASFLPAPAPCPTVTIGTSSAAACDLSDLNHFHDALECLSVVALHASKLLATTREDAGSVRAVSALADELRKRSEDALRIFVVAPSSAAVDGYVSGSTPWDRVLRAGHAADALAAKAVQALALATRALCVGALLQHAPQRRLLRSLQDCLPWALARAAYVPVHALTPTWLLQQLLVVSTMQVWSQEQQWASGITDDSTKDRLSSSSSSSSSPLNVRMSRRNSSTQRKDRKKAKRGHFGESSSSSSSSIMGGGVNSAGNHGAVSLQTPKALSVEPLALMLPHLSALVTALVSAVLKTRSRPLCASSEHEDLLCMLSELVAWTHTVRTTVVLADDPSSMAIETCAALDDCTKAVFSTAVPCRGCAEGAAQMLAAALVRSAAERVRSLDGGFEDFESQPLCLYTQRELLRSTATVEMGDSADSEDESAHYAAAVAELVTVCRALSLCVLSTTVQDPEAALWALALLVRAWCTTSSANTPYYLIFDVFEELSDLKGPGKDGGKEGRGPGCPRRERDEDQYNNGPSAHHSRGEGHREGYPSSGSGGGGGHNLLANLLAVFPDRAVDLIFRPLLRKEGASETRLAGADEAEPEQHLHGKFFRFVRNALRCSLPAFLDAFAPALLPSMLLAKDRTAFQALRGFDAATLRCCRDLSLTSLTDSPHAVYRMLISPLLLRYSARELLGGELKKVCVCVCVCLFVCLFVCLTSFILVVRSVEEHGDAKPCRPY
jgi:hypothetical protein